MDEVGSLDGRFLVDDDLLRSESDGVSTFRGSRERKTHQVHGLSDESTRQTDVDGRLLSVTRKDPDLDTRLLKRVDGVRHAVLKLVLDGRCTQQHEILLNQLGHVVESVAPPNDLTGSLVVHVRPLAVLLGGDLSRGEAERSKSLGSVVLQKHE